MEQPYKKRNRIPASCSVCRKRKSKCDRVKPVCGSCKKKSIVHLCYYETDRDSGPGTQAAGLNNVRGGSGGGGVAAGAAAGVGGEIGVPSGGGAVSELTYSYDNSTPGSIDYQYQGPGPGPNRHYLYVGANQVGSNESLSPAEGFGGFGANINGQNRMMVVPNGGRPPVLLSRGSRSHSDVYSSNQSSPSLIAHQQQFPYMTPGQFHPMGQFGHNIAKPLAMGQIPPQGPPGQLPQPNSLPPPQFGQPLPTSSPFPPQQQVFMPANLPPAMGVQPPYTYTPHKPGQKKPSSDYMSGQSAQASPLDNGGRKPAIGNNKSSSETLVDANAPFSDHGRSDSDSVVTIEFGPHSIIKVSKSDKIDIFRNASLSLQIEGPEWQQHGSMSYVGLAKSDPFLKFFRNYAISLFRSGGMSDFIKKKTVKRSKNNSRAFATIKPTFDPNERKKWQNKAAETAQTPTATEGNASVVNGHEKRNEKSESRKTETDEEIEYDEGGDEAAVDADDVVVEDSLIVTKIRASESKGPKSDTGTLHQAPSPFLSQFQSYLNVKSGRQEYYDIVKKTILDILPSKSNMPLLLNRFFKYVYPFIPILDEKSIKTDLSIVLPDDLTARTDRYQMLKIRNFNDLAVMGITLLMIQFGYMSLLHNDESLDGLYEDERKMIEDMKKYSAEQYIQAVSLCIPNDQVFRKSSIKNVQLLTLLYIYRMLAPNDCHGLTGTDSQILFGTIVKHAYSIGLNRDPTKYYTLELISKNPSLIETWRRLWHQIVILDAFAAIHSGVPLIMTNLDSSDVELPDMRTKSGKIQEMFTFTLQMCTCYRKLSNLIMDVKKKPRVIDILTEVKDLERMFIDFFGEDFFRNYICKPPVVVDSKRNDFASEEEREESYFKVMKFITFIQLRTNLSCIYHKIAMFYEDDQDSEDIDQNSSGIELFKVYITSVIQMLFINSYALDSSVKLFGRNYDYILTAFNERCMIKFHAFISSFFIRLIHHKKTLATKDINEPGRSEEEKRYNAQKLEAVDGLLSVVLSEAELFVGNFQKLSKKYINSYRLHVMSYLVLKQFMEDPDVFFEHTLRDDKFYHNGINALDFFSVQDLNFLRELCDEYAYPKDRHDKQEMRHRLKDSSQDNTKYYEDNLNLVSLMQTISSGLSEKQKNKDDVDDPVEIDSSIFNWIPELDNSNFQNEDLMKLFELYANPNQSSWNM